MPKKLLKNPKTKNLVLPDFARYFFALFIAAILGLFAWIVSPFLDVLVYSATIAVIFYPLHMWMKKRLPKHLSLAALLTTLFVMLMVLTPLALFFVFLGQEALSAYQLLSNKWVGWDLSLLRFDGLQDLPLIGNFIQAIAERFGFSDLVYSTQLDLVAWIQGLAESIAGFLVVQSTSILTTVGDTVLSFFILLLTVYFAFRDGGRFIEILKSLSPLPMRYETEIENKLRETTYAIVMGSFVTALIQGLAGGIGFAIAGVDNLVLWTSLMAFAALIPYFGPMLIWGPVSIALLIQGEVFWGVFIIAWGLCIVAVVDNIVRPLLIGSRTRAHSFVTFLAVLGGILVLGMKGIIFGPLILSLTITILHIYQLEYRDMLRD